MKGSFDSLALSDKAIHEIIGDMLRARRKSNSKYSQTYIARQAKIPNRSNLNEMLQGKRRIPKKYRQPLLDALGVQGLTKTYLLKRLEIEADRADDPSLLEEVSLIRRALALRYVEDQFIVSMASLKLFGAIQLLPKHRLTEDDRESNESVYLIQDLRKFLDTWSAQEINASLKELNHVGAIESDERLIRMADARLLFKMKSEQEMKQGAATIKRFLDDAIDHVEDNFQRSDVLYTSSIVTIDASRFKDALDKFEGRVEAFIAETESDQPNQMISVNVQVFPVNLEKGSPNDGPEVGLPHATPD